MEKTNLDFAEWAEELKTGGRPDVYSGERLRCVAMPMGGIGAGQLAVCGDGSLRQWQIFNNVNHQAHVPHSFFGLWVKQEGKKPVGRILASPALYDDKDFQPAESVSDHIVPAEQKRLLRTLPGVKDTEFVGEYPFATLRYRDRALPVDIEMTSYSPFIPLSVKDSSLPCIIFRFTVTNNSKKPVELSLVGTLQNAVGYDGAGEIKGIEFRGYGGNRNQLMRRKLYTALQMTNVILPADTATNGTMTLAALEPDGEVTALSGWEDPEALWSDFISEGMFSAGETAGPSQAGKTINGALAVRRTLQPGETISQRFVITWYFPNHYVNWNQKGLGLPDAKSRFWLGNMYNNWFQSSLDVVDYIAANYLRLASETLAFRNNFYDSTLPYWLLDAVTSQASTIRSPTCFTTEDGRLHAFEGCCGASTPGIASQGGCCPLNCTHVWNYEMSLSKLFPVLERTMRQTDLEEQQHVTGAIPHRTALPLYLKRWGVDDVRAASRAFAADGHCGTVLKTYREYLQSGDREFLDKFWPNVKLAMDFAFKTWDPDDDGVFDGPQWNTYDCVIYGRNSFTTGLFLAALRAAEEMAKVQGEHDLAEAYHRRFEKGRKNLDRETWNGEYYIQVYDEKQHTDSQYGIGCHSDQLLGQWWAHILDLGYILPEDRVDKALESIYRHNFRWKMEGHHQQPRVFASEHDAGLIICTWPHGRRPGRVTYYSDEVWTGIEYAVAGLMLYQGKVDEAFHIIKAARDRYDGSERNPWNEVECGDHYARAMASWSVLEGAMGFHINVSEGYLEFAPRLTGNKFKSFFITGTGWGSYTREKSDNGAIRHELSVSYGSVTVKRLKLAGAAANTTISGAGKIGFSTRQNEDSSVIEFDSPVVIKKGKRLVITLR